MESLGGDSLWWNRFLARHGAVAYYIILLVLFMLTPKYAYLFSELLELHAVDTYDEFCENNKDLLLMMSPTIESIDYLPNAENLYEVFMRISEDEYKHAQAMRIVRQLPK
jgi:ubiquinol oxidase